MSTSFGTTRTQCEPEDNPLQRTCFPVFFVKQDFLKSVVEAGNLLHGSNIENILQLEPRQAICHSKESGNQEAVYATNDPVLSIFYAILDRDKLGDSKVIIGMYPNETEDGYVYKFAIERSVYMQDPFRSGAVYILPKDSFEQLKDNNGNLTSEYASKAPVDTSDRLTVVPDDLLNLGNIIKIMVYDKDDPLDQVKQKLRNFNGEQQINPI